MANADATLKPGSVLEMAEPVPIANLRPDLPNLSSLAVCAVVTLTWPFSSIRKSVAFRVAEPDVRLRRDNGQVRVQFDGPAAIAVAEAAIGSGDEVVLSLDGAHWTTQEPSSRPPGSSLPWQLNYKNKLHLKVTFIDRSEPRLVEIDQDDSPPSPNPQLDLDAINALYRDISPDPISTPRPAVNHLSERLLDGEYTSPAYLKRQRLSYGSLFEDPWEDDGGVQGKGRKRTRFGRETESWRYTSQSRSPTPEPENDAEPEPEPEMEVEPQKPQTPVTPDNAAGESILVATPTTIPTPQPRPTMADESCQTEPIENGAVETSIPTQTTEKSPPNSTVLDTAQQMDMEGVVQTGVVDQGEAQAPETAPLTSVDPVKPVTHQDQEHVDLSEPQVASQEQPLDIPMSQDLHSLEHNGAGPVPHDEGAMLLDQPPIHTDFMEAPVDQGDYPLEYLEGSVLEKAPQPHEAPHGEHHPHPHHHLITGPHGIESNGMSWAITSEPPAPEPLQDQFPDVPVPNVNAFIDADNLPAAEKEAADALTSMERYPQALVSLAIVATEPDSQEAVLTSGGVDVGEERDDDGEDDDDHSSLEEDGPVGGDYDTRNYEEFQDDEEGYEEDVDMEQLEQFCDDELDGEDSYDEEEDYSEEDVVYGVYHDSIPRKAAPPPPRGKAEVIDLISDSEDEDEVGAQAKKPADQVEEDSELDSELDKDESDDNEDDVEMQEAQVNSSLANNPSFADDEDEEFDEEGSVEEYSSECDESSDADVVPQVAEQQPQDQGAVPQSPKSHITISDSKDDTAAVKDSKPAPKEESSVSEMVSQLPVPESSSVRDTQPVGHFVAPISPMAPISPVAPIPPKESLSPSKDAQQPVDLGDAASPLPASSSSGNPANAKEPEHEPILADVPPIEHHPQSGLDGTVRAESLVPEGSIVSVSVLGTFDPVPIISEQDLMAISEAPAPTEPAVEAGENGRVRQSTFEVIEFDSDEESNAEESDDDECDDDECDDDEKDDDEIMSQVEVQREPIDDGNEDGDVVSQAQVQREAMDVDQEASGDVAPQNEGPIKNAEDSSHLVGANIERQDVLVPEHDPMQGSDAAAVVGDEEMDVDSPDSPGEQLLQELESHAAPPAVAQPGPEPSSSSPFVTEPVQSPHPSNSRDINAAEVPRTQEYFSGMSTQETALEDGDIQMEMEDVIPATQPIDIEMSFESPLHGLQNVEAVEGKQVHVLATMPKKSGMKSPSIVGNTKQESNEQEDQQASPDTAKDSPDVSTPNAREVSSPAPSRHEEMSSPAASTRSRRGRSRADPTIADNKSTVDVSMSSDGPSAGSTRRSTRGAPLKSKPEPIPNPESTTAKATRKAAKTPEPTTTKATTRSAKTAAPPTRRSTRQSSRTRGSSPRPGSSPKVDQSVQLALASIAERRSSTIMEPRSSQELGLGHSSPKHNPSSPKHHASSPKRHASSPKRHASSPRGQRETRSSKSFRRSSEISIQLPSSVDQLGEGHYNLTRTTTASTLKKTTENTDGSIRLARASLRSPSKFAHATRGKEDDDRRRNAKHEDEKEEDEAQEEDKSDGKYSKEVENKKDVEGDEEEDEAKDEDAGIDPKDLEASLRQDLLMYNPLKGLKKYVNNPAFEAIAIVASESTAPFRAKGGPREYGMTFLVTDHSIAATAAEEGSNGNVVEVQVFHRNRDHLPIVKPGDAIMLRHFTVIGIPSKGFGLRNNAESAWAVFEGGGNGVGREGKKGGLPQIRGPPMEIEDVEVGWAWRLVTWFKGLDEGERGVVEAGVRGMRTVGLAAAAGGKK